MVPRDHFTISGTPPCILGHTTYDSSNLSSNPPPDSPIHVLTADGTSLPVDSKGTLWYFDYTRGPHVVDSFHEPSPLTIISSFVVNASPPAQPTYGF